MTQLQGLGSSRAQQIVIALALALGIGVRLRQYFANRSLWLDESLLAINIIERDFAGFLRPLAYDQVAPLGFLFVERLMVMVFGASEYALRAFPLMAGIATLVLFWRLAAAALLPAGVMMGVAVLAACERLIYYSAEVKQYGVDVGMTVVLWTVFVTLDPALKRNHLGAWAAAAVTGALALWLSHPAVFVLGGIGLLWLWHTVHAFAWRSVFVRGPVSVVWAGSFAAAYLVALRPISEGTSQHLKWASAAAPLVPVSIQDFGWYHAWLATLSRIPLGASLSKLVALVCVVGFIGLYQRRRDQFWWAIGALALAWLASVLGYYPLASRLWLFFAPISILAVGAAIDEVWRRSRGRLPILAPTLAVFLLAGPAVVSTHLLVSPPMREEVRPLLHHVRERYREGDRLYLYPGASAAARYYSARGLGFPGEVMVGVWGGDQSQYERDAERLRGGGRTWILISHVRRYGDTREDNLVLQAFDRIGTRLEERRETGAAVYLYRL